MLMRHLSQGSLSSAASLLFTCCEDFEVCSTCHGYAHNFTPCHAW